MAAHLGRRWAGPLLLLAAACGGSGELLAPDPAPEAAAAAQTLALARAAYEADPADAAAATAFAAELGRHGQTGAAIALLQPFAAVPGASAETARALAGLYRQEGRFLEAAVTCETAAAAAAGAERAWLFQSAAADRERAQDYAGALEDLRQALAEAPLEPAAAAALSRWLAFQTGRPESVADALALLQGHPDGDKRLAGAEFLAQQSFSGDRQAFANALSDEDPRVARLAAIEFCARAGALHAPQVALLLRHPDPAARLAAGRALGELGGAAGLAALARALDPDDRALFRAVNLSLEKLTGVSLSAELDPDREQRAALAAAWRSWLEAQPAAPEA